MFKATLGLMVGVSLLGWTLPAAAQDSGLASMHTWRKVGKKTCMADHYHGGSGTGATRQAAEAAAARDWVGFTDLEYGRAWADVRIAISKTMNCNQTGPNDFSCRIDAMACRPF